MTMVSVPRVIWPVISLLTVRPFLSPLLFSVAKGMEVRKIRVLGTMPASFLMALGGRSKEKGPFVLLLERSLCRVR